MDGPIFVCGHRGMVGSAIIRALQGNGIGDIITAERSEVDLTRQIEVEDFFENNEIGTVIIAAAKVGGIHANNIYPAEFIYQNLMIEANVIEASHQKGIENLIFLGSSCIYPKMSSQPIREEYLMTGKLEATNEPYAVAKIAGIKICESYNRQYGRKYRSLMPTNLYGPNDNFHPINSHVIPALIGRFHEAKEKEYGEVEIWGSGKPKREFLHVDDLADACIFIMSIGEEKIDLAIEPMQGHINVGSGIDYSIAELAKIIADVTGFEGDVVFDSSKPDGTLRKLLDVSLIGSLGWSAGTDLEEGLAKTYEWYLSNIDSIRS